MYTHDEVEAKMPPPLTIPRNAIEAAVEDGPLSRIAYPQRRTLLRGAHVCRLHPGEVMSGEDDSGDVLLVLDGMLRCSMANSSERRITLRYAERGELVGLMAVVRKMRDMRPVTWLTAASGLRYECDAVRDTLALVLRPEPFQALVREDPQVAGVMMCYLMETLEDAQRSHAIDVILPLRARLARHLLSLAEVERQQLVVRSTNQFLADATGSVRDVTARLIRDFAAAGWVARRGRVLVLLQPAALHEVAVGREPLMLDVRQPLSLACVRTSAATRISDRTRCGTWYVPGP